jgi:hypothetical protein
VASTVTCGALLMTASTRVATASMTCSQLSSTSSARRLLRYASSRARTALLGSAPSSGTPRASATASGTSGVADRGQTSQVHVLVEVTGELVSGGKSQRRLPGAARANKGDHPVPGEGLSELGELVIAADQVQRGSRHPAVRSRFGFLSDRRGLRGRRSAGSHLGPEQLLVLLEDALMELAQLRGGLQAELIVEVPTAAGENRQRLGLPARAVQSGHQQPRQRLLSWIMGDDRFEISRDLDVSPGAQRRHRALGQRRLMHLLEPGRFHRGPALAGEVREWVAAPQFQRLLVRLEGAVGVVSSCGSARGLHMGAEPVHIDDGWVDVRAVPRSVTADQVQPMRGEGTAELGHPQLQGVQRVRRQR